MDNVGSTPDRLLTLEDLVAITKTSRSKLYAMMRDDDFPNPIKLGRSSRWRESGISAWFERQWPAPKAEEQTQPVEQAAAQSVIPPRLEEPERRKRADRGRNPRPLAPK